MNDLSMSALAVGLLGTVFWPFLTSLAWLNTYGSKASKTWARLVLATPIWPIALIVLAAFASVSAIRVLWGDAFRKDN